MFILKLSVLLHAVLLRSSCSALFVDDAVCLLLNSQCVATIAVLLCTVAILGSTITTDRVSRLLLFKDTLQLLVMLLLLLSCL
jgi:hypothetical protein